MGVQNFCPNCFRNNTVNSMQCPYCGFVASEGMDKRALPQGVWLNQRYLIGRVLGIGGFGITYLGLDNRSQRRVAIKEYFPAEWAMRTVGSNVITPSSQSKDDLYIHGRDVFVNEANVLLGLKQNQNVVDVIDFFTANETAYLVMEYLEGTTLGHYMRINKTTLPIEEANEMVVEIGSALYEIHNHMLLHRDVSPDNIIKSANGKMKLIDFGATRIYALNSPKSMSVLVKPGFAPIEQYSRTGKQGPWTDVYALAATYYYLVSGKKPPAAPERITGSPVKPLSQIVEGIPLHISEAIKHALRNDWQKRPKNVKEFLEEMNLAQGRKNKVRVPYLIEQSNGNRWAFRNHILKIGRNKEQCDIKLSSSQISGLHCSAEFEPRTNSFCIHNYSSNRTYTAKGVLEKGMSIRLAPGEWFYLQTHTQRFLFYLEVK